MLLLLLTSVLLMISGVGVVHGESPVTPRPGEALMMCTLTEDIRQTKKNFFIRHFSYKGDKVVFSCQWLAQDPDNPDCRSRHDFTLMTLGKYCVVVSVPRSHLKDGSFKCQLVSQDDANRYTRCWVFHSDDAEDPPTAISAVTPSTAADQPQPRDQTEDPPTAISAVTPSTAADQPQPGDQIEEEPTGANGDNLWRHVVMAFTALMFLLNLIGMAVLYVRLGRHRRRKLLNSFGQKESPVNFVVGRCEAEDNVTSEAAWHVTEPVSKSSSSTDSEIHPELPLPWKDREPVNGVGPTCGAIMIGNEKYEIISFKKCNPVHGEIMYTF